MAARHPDQCCPTDKGAAKCEYTPTGNDFYVVGPLDSKAGVVVVSDIFGMLPNSKRLADMLAKEGYLAIMPDFFGDKAWDHNKWPADFESAEWQEFIGFARDFKRHQPRVESAIALLRKLGCAKVGTVGMCWGSTLAFTVAADSQVDAACAAHPAFFAPELVKNAKTPVLVLPSKDEGPMDDVEAAVNAHPQEPHVFRHFHGIPHGFFGARYDPEAYAPAELQEVEEARGLLLDFFKKTLH